MFKKMFRNLTILATALCLAMILTATPSSATEPLKFGVPAWPGLTVKSEVAAQILETIGYPTKQFTSSPSIVLKSLENRDMDIYLGGWIPQETEMINSVVEKGTVIKVVKNLSNCMIGMAVPTYVWEAGVHSMADLEKHPDRFERRLYGIEAGSGINKKIKEVIANDGDSLGDWSIVESSAAGMLAQVERATRRKDWIVFFAWEPHWMGAVYDFRYLKATDESNNIADKKSWVWTVVRSNLPETHPQVYRFLEQFTLKSDTQSEWIFQFKRKEKEPRVVAREWIASHLDTVDGWLQGVKGPEGEPAADILRRAFQ